jgi:Tfp pilus assembly protein PilN
MRALHAQQAASRRTPLFFRMAAAFAMVVCLVAVVQFAIVQQKQRARIETLRAEQQRIEAELEAVKKIADDAEPVVVLEDDRGTRVIMDLDTAVQPASLRTYD